MKADPKVWLKNIPRVKENGKRSRTEKGGATFRPRKRCREQPMDTPKGGALFRNPDIAADRISYAHLIKVA